jgi:excinuclease UvrABC helicase subunit UvrB
MLVVHPTFHVSKLKPIHDNKKRKDKKQAYHQRFDIIKHNIIKEVECILATRKTKQIGNQYLIKWKGCHPKESHWMKLAYLDHLLKMVENFEWELGHETGNGKMH